VAAFFIVDDARLAVAHDSLNGNSVAATGMSNQGRKEIDARAAPLLCSACLHRLELMLGRQCLLSRKAVNPEPG
jgi:hypothetical protein